MRDFKTISRIAVVGRSGSGKSTLAKKLGGIMDLPVYHLDKFFWQPGWVEAPRVEFESRHDAIIYEDRWILDGNNTRTMPGRFRKAQFVVFFDFPLWYCLLRFIVRGVRHYGRTRDDMAEGCPERPTFSHMRYMMRFNKVTKPKIEDVILSSGTPHVVLKSERDAQDFLDSVRDSINRGDEGDGRMRGMVRESLMERE